MNRAERRAAEHLARKAARQEMKLADVTVENPAISDAQLVANRANAKLSTGPATEAGKSKCSHNAVKTALTGQTVLLRTDDVAEYEKLGRILVDHYKPASEEEERLVQCLIDADWRLRRIPVFEMGIFAIGRQELAGTVPGEVLEAAVYLKYERNLKNLALQDHRIRRNREKDLLRLQELQSARREREAALRKIQQMREKQQQQPGPAPENGSEISTPDIAAETGLFSAA
jgi:hypothetical protein